MFIHQYTSLSSRIKASDFARHNTMRTCRIEIQGNPSVALKQELLKKKLKGEISESSYNFMINNPLTSRR